jgi:hypothetical protein
MELAIRSESWVHATRQQSSLHVFVWLQLCGLEYIKLDVGFDCLASDLPMWDWWQIVIKSDLGLPIVPILSEAMGACHSSRSDV